MLIIWPLVVLSPLEQTVLFVVRSAIDTPPDIAHMAPVTLAVVMVAALANPAVPIRSPSASPMDAAILASRCIVHSSQIVECPKKDEKDLPSEAGVRSWCLNSYRGQHL